MSIISDCTSTKTLRILVESLVPGHSERRTVMRSTAPLRSLGRGELQDSARMPSSLCIWAYLSRLGLCKLFLGDKLYCIGQILCISLLFPRNKVNISITSFLLFIYVSIPIIYLCIYHSGACALTGTGPSGTPDGLDRHTGPRTSTPLSPTLMHC